MPRPSQALLLSKIEWEHLPCLASLIHIPKLVPFPSFPPLPISSCLVFPSPRLQGSKSLKKSWLMFFPNLEFWCKSVLLQVIKIPNTIWEMCRSIQSLNMSFLYIVLFVFGSFHISKSFGISNMGLLWKNTKWKYLQCSKNNTNVSGNENQDDITRLIYTSQWMIWMWNGWIINHLKTTHLKALVPSIWCSHNLLLWIPFLDLNSLKKQVSQRESFHSWM